MRCARVLGAVVGLTVAGCGAGPTGPGAETPSGPVARPIRLADTSAREFFSALGQSGAGLQGGGYATAWNVGTFPVVAVAVQLLRPDGSALLPENGLVFASDPVYTDQDAVVVAHPSSGVFVGFTRRDIYGNGSILVASLDGEGRTRWSAGVVEVAAPIGYEIHTNPQLASDGAGGVYVCFQPHAFSRPSTEVAIRCQHLDAGGATSWGRYGLLAGGREGQRVVPRVVGDGAGGVMVFWRNQGEEDRPGEPMLMEGQHFTRDGARLWGEGLVIRRTNLPPFEGGHGFTFYDVVSDGRGGAVMSLDDLGAAGATDTDVVAQRVAFDGSLQWGAGVTVAGGASTQYHETLVAAPDGGAFIAVRETLGSNRRRLLLHRLGPDGRQVWPAAGTALSDPAATANNQDAVGAYEAGTLWMAWTQQAGAASATFEARLARFADDGRRLDDAAGAILRSEQGRAFFSRHAFLQSGRFFTASDDAQLGASGQSDVSATLVTLEPR